MYLDAVDIDGVLVEVTAAHVILGAEFIILVDAGEGDKQTLDATAGSVRHDACERALHLVHLPGAAGQSAHLDLLKPLGVGEQFDVHIDDVAIGIELLSQGHIADHGIGDIDSILQVEREAVVAVLIGCSAGHTVLEIDVSEFDAYVFLINNVSVHANLSCVYG